jgi:hypothetical protein
MPVLNLAKLLQHVPDLLCIAVHDSVKLNHRHDMNPLVLIPGSELPGVVGIQTSNW